jgi:hypothetical protein
MQKIGDHVQFREPHELAQHLHNTAQSFDTEAKRIWQMRQLGDACRVLPNVLRCTARQLRILAASAGLPIEVAAGACRTVFEVNLRLRLVATSSANLQDFQVERVFDELGFLSAFKGLANSSQPPSGLALIESRIKDIQCFIKKRNLVKPRRQTVLDRAKAVGLEREYQTLYGFYSKYVHGSAWLVNAADEERDGEDYRNIFTILAQRYAADTFECVCEYVKAAAID